MSGNKQDADSSKKRKYPPKIITQYAKKKFVKAFSMNGSGLQTCRHILEYEHKGSAEDVTEFINNVAECAQENVEEEVASDEFAEVEKWVKYAKSQKFDSDCGFELPLLLKSIAETEQFPEYNPETDIDYCMLYNWLAEVMLGNAPPELNPRSQVFLVENLTSLLNEIDAPGKEKELNALIQALKTPAPPKDTFIKSVDPFRLNVKNKL